VYSFYFLVTFQSYFPHHFNFKRLLFMNSGYLIYIFSISFLNIRIPIFCYLKTNKILWIEFYYSKLKFGCSFNCLITYQSYCPHNFNFKRLLTIFPLCFLDMETSIFCNFKTNKILRIRIELLPVPFGGFLLFFLITFQFNSPHCV